MKKEELEDWIIENQWSTKVEPRLVVETNLMELIEQAQSEIRQDVLGMIVKNSTGFDTIGEKRIWHLDIDAFEKELNSNP